MNIVKGLLRDLDVEESLRNSYINYHVKGLDYLCLHRSKELTIKLYHWKGSPGVPLVAPHNHAYYFDEIILVGDIVNITFTPNAFLESKEYDEHYWVAKSSVFVRPIDLEIKTDSLLRQGSKLSQDMYTVHTLVPMSEEFSILCYQYKTRRLKTMVYPKSGDVINTEGLYLKPSSEEFDKMWHHALECCKL